METGVRSTLVAVVWSGALLAAACAAAQVSSGPAAVVVFPRIVIGGSREVDTVVQLGNASDEPVEVRCLYSDETPECLGTGTCMPTRQSCDGACVARHVATPFRLRLTPHQPLGWSVAQGRSELPLEGVGGPGGANNAGSVPPITSMPFEGLLHCVVVDDRGVPAERNVLIGTASIETTTGGAVDAAQYNAAGFEAIPGGNDGDEILRLGGPQPEYAACPQSLLLSHFFDAATVRAGVYAGTTSTTLALVPCGGDLLGADAPRTVVELLTHNEFGQRLSTSVAFAGQLVSPISSLDTSQPDRSIFSAGVTGTLTGDTELRGFPPGLLGVAVETQRSNGNSVLEHSAALAIGTEGTTAGANTLAMLQPPCAGDCNADGVVHIDELLLAINIALNTAPVEACLAADVDASAAVRINELTSAVQVALSNCPAPRVPTEVPTQPTPQATPSPPVLPGPDITFLGIASGDDVPQSPIGTDDDGRPIFTWPVGQGFTLIVEARPGTSTRPVGRTGAVLPLGDVLPDLQVIVSRALGDGSDAYCDADPPALGGVPATVPFEFKDDDPNAILAINDLGCRADDGFGEPFGRTLQAACTRLQPTGEIAPIVEQSTTQFCIPIARAWAFPEGDTMVRARVCSVSGEIGTEKEIVVRIPAAP